MGSRIADADTVVATSTLLTLPVARPAPMRLGSCSRTLPSRMCISGYFRNTAVRHGSRVRTRARPGAGDRGVSLQYRVRSASKEGAVPRRKSAGVRGYPAAGTRSPLASSGPAASMKLLPVSADGILRSVIFPGLWLEVQPFLDGNMRRVLETLHRGLQSPEHDAFVAELVRRKS